MVLFTGVGWLVSGCDALAIVMALGVVQLGLWQLHHLVLTGYPLYPLPVLRIAADWSMHDASVRAYRDRASAFARVHGPDFARASHNFDWSGGSLQLSARGATNQFAARADVPQVPLVLRTTDAGLQIYGPPAGSDQIWDAPLPASPWPPDPDLRLHRAVVRRACGS